MAAPKDITSMLTHERLKEVLYYAKRTGRFTWIKASGRRSAVGSRAGWSVPSGYRRINIDGQAFLEHRLAWFYVYAAWPKAQLDHRNLDKSDNRFSNLREATPTQNMLNKPRYKNNTSGFIGFTYYKPTGVWRAELRINGQHVYLGQFPTAEAASAAYQVEIAKTRGKFAYREAS